MPQVFQVLCCFKCEMFQVHQVKKSNKWQCRICNEKQSLKKAFKIGSGRDCRHLVQELNMRKSNNTYEETDEEMEDPINTSNEANRPSDEADFEDCLGLFVEKEDLLPESNSCLTESLLHPEIYKENPAVITEVTENYCEHEKKVLTSQSSGIVKECAPVEKYHKRPLEDPIEDSKIPLIKRNKGFQFILNAASKLK